MTDADAGRWGNRVFEVEREAFFMSREARQRNLSDLEAFIQSVEAKELKPPEWLYESVLSVENLLRFIQACDQLADQTDSPEKFAEVYIRGFLVSHSHMLQPLGEEMARGAELAKLLQPETYLENAKVDPISFDLACRWAAVGIERGEVLSGGLAKFASDVLKGIIKRPTKNGQKPYVYMFRDAVIRQAIGLGDALNLPPTRNDASTTLSGCDVVAAFLSERGLFPATFAGVKRIWMARGEGFELIRRTMKTGED